MSESAGGARDANRSQPVTLSIQHIDTCMPAYVQYHCNGEGELLVGVPVDRSTRYWQLLEDITEQLHNAEKLPQSITQPMVDAAVAELRNRVHPLRCFDPSLDKASEDAEFCYAWFRATWETEEDDLAA